MVFKIKFILLISLLVTLRQVPAKLHDQRLNSLTKVTCNPIVWSNLFIICIKNDPLKFQSESEKVERKVCVGRTNGTRKICYRFICELAPCREVLQNFFAFCKQLLLFSLGGDMWAVLEESNKNMKGRVTLNMLLT